MISIIKLHVILIGILLVAVTISAQSCDNGAGECKNNTAEDCPSLYSLQHQFGATYCDDNEALICCPVPLNVRNQISVDNQRRSETECKKYNDLLDPCPPKPFIVDGIKAKGREFPFMALIGSHEWKKSEIHWFCGGALIHPRFVLTAAHCLTYNSEETKDQRLDPNFDSPKFIVRVGELDYNSTSDDARPIDFKIINFVSHPSYDYDTQAHDIGLIELDGNITINEYTAPACLPTGSGNEHLQLTTAGWGNTQNSGNPSSHLLKTTLERFDHDICVKRVQQPIDNSTQFCAGSTTSNADTCQGDSGGPIFIQHLTHQCMKQIIGITSYGLICGTRNIPSVYTKVHLYTDWIEKVVWGDTI